PAAAALPPMLVGARDGRGRVPRCLALNYGVTGLAFIALLVGWLAVTLPDVQIVPLMIASVAVVVIVPILFFPFSKTIWVALDLLLHRVDPKDSESITGTFGMDDRSR